MIEKNIIEQIGEERVKEIQECAICDADEVMEHLVFSNPKLSELEKEVYLLHFRIELEGLLDEKHKDVPFESQEYKVN